MDRHVYIIEWQGVSVELTYWPLKWNTISHLTVAVVEPTGAPLPITETGFKSHFFAPSGEALTKAEVVALVVEWLDEAAQSPKWLKHVEASRQGELF